MFNLLDDWKAWTGGEQAAVASVGLGLTMLLLGWLGV
jgi:hypothetical protein